MPQSVESQPPAAPEVTAAELRPIADRVMARARLDAADGRVLLATRDLPGVWALADAARRRASGPATFYAVNGHINYTNCCVQSCAFCGFSRRKDAGAPDAFEMTVEQVAGRAGRIAAEGATEIHIVGGLHPDCPAEYYTGMLAAIRTASPRIGIKAFTAVEVCHAARKAGLPPREMLLRLREAGLDALPGGGAEILVDEVRRRVCPGKETSGEWLSLHRAAHELGIRSTATMLFGHVESHADRIEHLMRLREIQDLTGGFLAFVALPYRPMKGPDVAGHGPGPSDILRTVAVSRLMLDNFAHVKAYWVALGMDVAQVALSCGADDLHGTALSERIFPSAAADAPAGERAALLRRIVEDAGLTAVERDVLYRTVVRGPGGPLDWRVEGR